MKKYLIAGLGLLIAIECSNSLLAKERLVQTCPGGYIWCSQTGQCVPNNQECDNVFAIVPKKNLTVLDSGTYFSCVLKTVLSESGSKFQGHTYHICQGESGIVEPVDQLNSQQYTPKPGILYTFPASSAVSCHKNQKPVRVSTSSKWGVVYRCPHHNK